MQNDLISRSALKAAVASMNNNLSGIQMLIENAPAVDAVSRPVVEQIQWERDCAIQQLKDHGIPFGGIAPAVDSMVLPKGRPGDYLEWETGIVGHTTIQPIKAILICEDCVRYDLGVFAPTVDHENIVRIMSREEAEREIERRAKNGK